MLSPQENWQKKKVASGLCRNCGKISDRGHQRCSPCQEKMSNYNRAWYQRKKQERKERAAASTDPVQ
mgnify:FL=1